MSKVIGVLSGKGGVGKTTVVANLGASLVNDFNRNVLLIDCNVTTSNLGLHFGMYSDLPITLREVLEKNVPVAHSVFFHHLGVRIIPAPLNGKITKFTKFNKIIKKIKNDYEIVLIDCAPGLGKEVLVATKPIDQAIVVTTPDLPAVTDALKTIDFLNRLKKSVLGIVLNRVKNEKYELTIKEIESTCKCNVISVIPEDSKIPESIANGVPVCIYDKKSKATAQLKKLAAYLVGEKYITPSLWESIKRFFGLEKLEIKTHEKEFYQEVTDIEKLKTELRKEVERDLKKEIMERVKEKLREKIYE